MFPPTDLGPQHAIHYRQELAKPLFAKIQSRESCAVIGAASMGKSRLLQFILRADVGQHYLQQAQATTLLVWIDCNRMASFSAWGLHELLLTGLLEASIDHPIARAQREALTQLRREAIVERNKLLAQRNVELALQIFCQELKLQVCFILDEFDEAYRSLSPRSLASLRALRDHHKYQVSYVLLLRHHPMHLRPPTDCEGFYELFSRSMLGLGPYGAVDTRQVIEQIQTRRGHELPPLSAAATEQLGELSGGHPGLLVALLDVVISEGSLPAHWTELAQTKVNEECRKLWEGLRREERETLHHIAQAVATDFRQRESLLLKGIIRESRPGQVHFFSPLFAAYAAQQAPTVAPGLRIDLQTGTVWVEGRAVEALTAREFELLACLAEEPGKLYEAEEILAALYAEAEALDVDSGYVAALVRRVRAKIEHNPGAPQYLLNVRGRGYRLVMEPE
ncbi:MAG: winged helix-turn-helix transcriptional regulator [Caldilineaceae bacterium]|nr:winged helix-turn-helix transcriptional regulator [Caldilineaceae bacterium]